MRSRMLYLIGFVVVVAVVALAMRCAKASELVPTWTWGPSLAVTRSAQNGTDLYHTEFMTGGAGVQVNCNFIDANQFPWLGVSAPFYLRGNSTDDSFAISPGLLVTIVGNFSVGATYDVFKSSNGVGSGLMTGKSSWSENGALIFSVGVPWSGGPQAAVYTAGR